MYALLEYSTKKIYGPIELEKARELKRSPMDTIVKAKTKKDVDLLRDKLKWVDQTPQAFFNFEIPEESKIKLVELFQKEDLPGILKIVDKYKIAQICDLCERQETAYKVIEYGINKGLL